MSARPVVLVAALATVWLVWGSTYFAIRVALEGFPPFGMAAVRLTAAGAVLLVGARLLGDPWPARRDLGPVAFAGVLMFLLGNGSVVHAEQTVSSGLVAVLVGIVPVYTAALARLYGMPVSGVQWAGMALGAAGLVVLHLDEGLRGDPWVSASLTVGSVAWAWASLVSKLRSGVSPGMMSGVQMVAGGLALAVASLAAGERWSASPPLSSVVAMAYLFTFGSIVAFSAYNYLLRHASIAVATSYAYVNPVVAVLLGVTLGGEVLAPSGWAGLGLIVAAVGLVTRKPSAR